MDKIRIGILGTADIAFRRFLPALVKCDKAIYYGVASRVYEKTEKFSEAFGGRRYGSYDEMINDGQINAVYIPLPPSLHYEWAKKALENGKHVLLEKPSTTSLKETGELVKLAEEKNLALKENYMFLHHPQIAEMIGLIEKNAIGKMRLVRIAFGFPKRGEDDFRYQKGLGGGALLDCGGYTLRLASLILGKTARVTASALNSEEPYDVDIFGSVTLQNDQGLTAQVSFGMDHFYRCELELWGSAGYIKMPRVFTAPPDFGPEIILETLDRQETIKIEMADQFLLSIEEFIAAASSENIRNIKYQDLILQMRMVDNIRRSVDGGLSEIRQKDNTSH